MDPHYVLIIDYGSNGSKICPPSTIMAPMDPHSSPLNDYDSHGSFQKFPLIDNGYHGSTLFPTQL